MITYTIEDALKAKEDEDKKIAESFDTTWNNYHVVSDRRSEAIKALNNAKIRIVVLNFISSFISSDVSNELNNLIKSIRNATKELKEEKELLYKIDIALEKLQAHNVNSCNYDLCELLSYLYDKYNAIYNKVVDEFNASSLRLRGINTTQIDNDMSLEEVNDKINSCILTLGLGK